MIVLLFLIPLALAIGVAALLTFFWAQENGQFDDPEGSAARILRDDDLDGSNP